MEQENMLVWIDLEMTGLDPRKDVIIEIASIITDSNLTIIDEGPSLVIHHEQKILDTMHDAVKKMHHESGLTEKSFHSVVSLAEAEQKTLAFIKDHCPKGNALLAGNSVYNDRNFLVPYMPHVVSYLHYRLIDVSSVKELVKRWYPHDPHISFEKRKTHRAADDIRESIAELKHYRKYFLYNLF
jgi:Oligoribonuclease (3''->5'' exoribonuclease)